MSNFLVIQLPTHGEVGYDTELNAALNAIVSYINQLRTDVDSVLAAPASDLTIVPNGDDTLAVTAVGPDVSLVDNGDDTFTLTVLQPAALTVVDNGDGTLEVTP